ncbi:thiol-disulfide oxidoreductase DCC family protein [Paenibacillus sp. 1P07SE]|uniref:thiol-disulfide oxidoreductase DCC family protein n=1 Tax=Paenibacillus sp. 1P07SE TaxID=3132209 RepID=UPI0039A4BDE2
MNQDGGEEPGTIMLFDGYCGMCCRSVQFVLKRDRNARFRFASLQSRIGRRLVKRHGAEEIDSIMLLQDGQLYVKSDAALRVGSQLGGLWRLCQWLLRVPRPWRDAVYDGVARNRYRWFGKRETCMLPAAHERERFLEDGS